MKNEANLPASVSLQNNSRIRISSVDPDIQPYVIIIRGLALWPQSKLMLGDNVYTAN